MTAAWFCPACQKHHAPHVETCPGAATPFFAPSAIEHWNTLKMWNAAEDPCAQCKGACGNTACPKLPRIMSATMTATGLAQ